MSAAAGRTGTLLILGSGVAGLTCAISAAAAGTGAGTGAGTNTSAEVLLVTPGAFDRESGDADMLAGGNTAMAQGGIAAAVGADDDPRDHTADTLTAGAGLVDAAAAAQLTAEGAAAMRALIDDGFAVDRGPSGEVTLGLEAAHGRARIVHAGEDRTGASLHVFLRARLLQLVAEGRVRLIENTTAVSLLSENGAVSGAVLREADGSLSVAQADAVVLATGGYAGVYPETSNHLGARGEGIVLASRVGAVVADLEFVQFHPTILSGTRSLISEAVRGAGALLLDGSGRRFMLDAPEAEGRAELAPRDVVSRVAYRTMRERGERQVWLDATVIEQAQGAGSLARRFPTITASTRAKGFDWAREPVPVAPASHYAMGGVVTDLDGRTSMPGLFAAGEVASTGVHGANRLASNSLLEGLVFGARAASAALSFIGTGRALWQLRGDGARSLIEHAEAYELPVPAGAADLFEAWSLNPSKSEVELRAAISSGLGIVRDREGITATSEVAAAHEGPMAELICMIAASALAREESRGAHQRADFTATDPVQGVRRAQRRVVRPVEAAAVTSANLLEENYITGVPSC